MSETTEQPKQRIIAIQERCTGNSSVGSMWYEAKSFDANTPIGLVVKWARSLSGGEGKLIITVDSNGLEEDLYE